MKDKRAIILESTLIGLTTLERRGFDVEATFLTKGFMGEYVQRVQVDSSPVWLGSRMHSRFDIVLRPEYHPDDLESDEVLAKKLADRLGTTYDSALSWTCARHTAGSWNRLSPYSE
jgi:hypothetical protein